MSVLMARRGTMAAATESHGLRLPGTAGNYVSSSDSVLNSVTGDIDIRVCVKLDDWTPATDTQHLIGKGNGHAYNFAVKTDGRLEYWFAYTGGIGFKASTASTGFADGAVGWVRVTQDVDNGAGGNDIKFYTSIDGITWTQLGTTVTTAGVVAILDAIQQVRLGGIEGGPVATNVTGTIYYAEIRAGIDGQVVSRFDASQVQASGAQVPAAVNGWTVNGTALYRRDDYIRLPGTSGNYLSYPDTVANSVTGDIDIRWHGSLDDWTPAAAMILVAKNTTNQFAYQMHVDTAGKLVCSASGGGVTADLTGRTSSSALGFADGSVWWVRFTRDATTGVVTLYTSPDGSTWTTIAGVGIQVAGAIFDSTNPVMIGANFSGSSNMLAGNVYAAEVRNGIGGTVVASFDARDITTPWTVNGTGWSWEGASFAGKPVTALSLTGAVSNYVTTPDAASHTVTDLDLRAKVTMTSWASGATQRIISKEAPTTQRSYGLGVNSTGALLLRFSLDGSAATELGSTSNTGFAAGATHWVRMTRMASTGVNQFFTSTDGVAWTKLGNDVTGATGAPFDSTAAIELGVRAATNEPMAGTLHYAEVRNGIDGPIVARFDPTAIARTGTRTPTTTVQPGGTPNMLTPNQASIETDAAGWGANANCTIARSTSEFLDGVASLALTSVAAGQMTAINVPIATATMAVVPGKAYTGRVSYKAATVARNVSVMLNWYTAAGTYIVTHVGTTVADATGAWTAAPAFTSVAPATAGFGGVVITVDGTGGAGEVHYADRISFVEAAATWTMNGSAWDYVQVPA